MNEHFVSEAIKPAGETFDAARMAHAEPGVPGQFTWRGRTFTVTEVLRTWKDTGPCRHGSGERYVRKHWFEVATTSGETLKLYFERQARGGRTGPRWWLFSIDEAD